jgi:hypothetical protein
MVAPPLSPGKQAGTVQIAKRSPSDGRPVAAVLAAQVGPTLTVAGDGEGCTPSEGDEGTGEGIAGVTARGLGSGEAMAGDRSNGEGEGDRLLGEGDKDEELGVGEVPWQ